MTTLEKIAVIEMNLDRSKIDLTRAHANAFEAADALATAKFVFTAARGWILTHNDPKDLGANEAQREAALAERCESELNDVHHAENNLRRTQDDLTLAQLDFDATKLQVRLLECATRLLGSEG
jgi:hypothetical protein